MTFGSRLKALRQDNKLLQKDLAKILGVTSGAIGMYENDKRTPDFETLRKIVKFFNVSTDYILEIVDEKDSIKLTSNKDSRELRAIGEDYLIVAKEMQDKEISIADIRKILEVLDKKK